MKKIIALALIITVAITVSALALYKVNANRVDVRDLKLVSTLNTKDGKVLGDVYVKYLKDDYFRELYILGENKEVLYKMDENGFFNTKGKDFYFSSKGFYAYKITLKGNDYVVFNLLGNEGKDISDDLTLHWNYETNIFEIRKDPF